MTTIRAKPTLYQGSRFRSRLEARWAAFFDAIGRDWVYEPAIPELSSVQYQPDFMTSRTTDSGISLIEIKPIVDPQTTVKHLHDERWHRVANLSQCKFVLLFGTPGSWLEGRITGDGHFGVLFSPDEETAQPVEFAECLECREVNLWPGGAPTCCKPLASGPLLDAYRAVRDTSFEDGADR